ncbi:16S rRNA (uracil(1498)-N(3))-methyltransferase [Curvibacter sp. HBC61]|uniref:Ribosomal RNA small subunit methyltransferase E n=1 Tax=Curvibacter cyanobacteriorum TaxID=3026422 RepID=A0ABT5MZK8_9BURK|nr:16S rRNA (uracil(1498)-N(3))-methyltransferase [Curvibacter sp. HBC61]MDD0839491.1 16S rRNA (uracil(1498)-N(3))-methyltransferase [Curvibacter sp. HBC61]
MPRFHCPAPLATGAALSLPPGTARHVQVLRLQPGDTLTLFNGEGGEFEATVTRMGRSDVDVEVGAHHAIERELSRAVHLVVAMPANDRMDWLVEKATELGAASIQPVMAAHNVLRLKGERADKKVAHWQAVAVGACEQCGRNRVPLLHPVLDLADWLRRAGPLAPEQTRMLLSLREGTRPLAAWPWGQHPGALTVLNGPEGGLNREEEDAAVAAGFVPFTLGPRVLRAETAPLAVLAGLPD